MDAVGVQVSGEGAGAYPHVAAVRGEREFVVYVQRTLHVGSVRPVQLEGDDGPGRLFDAAAAADVLDHEVDHQGRAVVQDGVEVPPLKGAGAAGAGAESVLPGGDLTLRYSVALEVGRRRGDPAALGTGHRVSLRFPCRWRNGSCGQPPAATPRATLRVAMIAPPTVIA